MPEERPASITDDQIQERIRRIEATFKLDPQVSLHLGGVDYKLEFNNFAAKYVFKTCGVNILKDAITRETFEHPDVYGAMLHGAMLTHHPEMTLEDCDKINSLRHAPLIMLKLQQAIQLFMPDLSDMKPGKDKGADPKDPT